MPTSPNLSRFPTGTEVAPSSSDAPPVPSHPMWCALALFVLALGAFVASCLLLDRVLPARDWPPTVQEKIAHLVAHGGEYDALFLGSSRIQSHVMPAVFDRDLAAQNLPVKSFNAGVAGMYPPQDGWLLDQILRLHLFRGRWVFIESQMLQITLPRTNRDTLQLLSWHDWPRFWLVCQRFVTTRERRRWRDRLEEIEARWPDFADHVVLFVRRFTNLGRGMTLLNRAASLEKPPPFDSTILGTYGDGWFPNMHVPAGEEITGLEGDLAKRRGSPAVKEGADAISRKALDGMVARIQKTGARPVLVIPPTLRGTYFCPYPASTEQLIILDFSDPRKYPELYELKYRADSAHLNAAGAEIFTHLMATEFRKAVGEY